MVAEQTSVHLLKKAETTDALCAVILVHTNYTFIHKDNLFLRQQFCFWIRDKMTIGKLIQF